MNVFEDSHAYAIRRDHAAEVTRVADALSRGAASAAPPTCANPWYDADPSKNTCSLDPSLLYGAFGACPAHGSTCRGIALGDADSYARRDGITTTLGSFKRTSLAVQRRKKRSR